MTVSQSLRIASKICYISFNLPVQLSKNINIGQVVQAIKEVKNGVKFTLSFEAFSLTNL